MFATQSISPVYPHKLRRLYWPFLALAETCRDVIGSVAGSFGAGERRYTIPRFTFLGPTTNVPQKRVGFFALLHGDEPAGALTLLKLLQTFTAEPVLAAGYDLVFYPVCNPTGYEDDTRYSRAGADLGREFWRSSSQPEVQILEEELKAQPFDGIISLCADGTTEALDGHALGHELNDDLIAPALRAAEKIIPSGELAEKPGRFAGAKRFEEKLKSSLRPSPDRPRHPFEMIFVLPARAALDLQAQAAHAAVQTVLSEYRRFIAYAQDL